MISIGDHADHVDSRILVEVAADSAQLAQRTIAMVQDRLDGLELDRELADLAFAHVAEATRALSRLLRTLER